MACGKLCLLTRSWDQTANDLFIAAVHIHHASCGPGRRQRPASWEPSNCLQSWKPSARRSTRTCATASNVKASLRLRRPGCGTMESFLHHIREESWLWACRLLFREVSRRRRLNGVYLGCSLPLYSISTPLKCPFRRGELPEHSVSVTCIDLLSSACTLENINLIGC